MLENAAELDWQETGTEIEALILESQLIKKYKPQFNIMLRDDKQYFYVALTQDTFPKIFITHQLKQKAIKIASAIGPFTDGGSLRTTLKLLRKIFPYCSCRQTHNNYCLNYHIGNCLGFCCLKNVTKDKTQINIYKKNIRAIKEILQGKRDSLIKKLEKDMVSESNKNNFEEAIKIRSQLEKTRNVFENARIISELPSKGGVLEELQKTLKLTAPPERIEGYDISNIQGQFATGAMVVFTDGKPDKNQYRKFKIKIAGSPNDTAMLQEILSRRLRHPEWKYPDLILVDGGKGQLNAIESVLKNSGVNIPVVALTKNKYHYGDHISSTTSKQPISLNKLLINSRNLILSVDAEAHRFAISYYRKLHRSKHFRG